MVKKNIFLAIGLMASLVSVHHCNAFLSYFKSNATRLTEQEKIEHETLITLYKSNSLNQYQFVDNNGYSIALMDNAIALVKKHKTFVGNKKNNAYGYLYNTKQNNLSKITGISLQIVSLAGTALASYCAYDYYHYCSDKNYQRKVKSAPPFTFFDPIAVFTAITATLSYIFCRDATSNFIQDMQNQFDLDVTIIAKLKEIKSQANLAG